jgi:hypothetical protein
MTYIVLDSITDTRMIIQTEAAEVVLRDINLRLLGTKSIIQFCIANHIGIMFSYFGITEFSSYFKRKVLHFCSLSSPSTQPRILKSFFLSLGAS